MDQIHGSPASDLGLPMATTAGTRPLLYDQVPGTDKKMAKYCEACGVDKKDVDKLICRGEVLAKDFKAFSAQGMAMPVGNREDVKALMWFFMAEAAACGEEHFSGAFQIDDPNGEVYKWIQESLQDRATQPPTPGHYQRISTHMKEHLTDKGQIGSDFAKGELPGGMKTLLLASINGPKGNEEAGKTLYIKFESVGCPPFWKKGHRTFENFKTYMEHAGQWAKTRVVHAYEGGYTQRKEHVPSKMKKEYTQIMTTHIKSHTKANKTAIRTQDLSGGTLGVAMRENHINRAEAALKEGKTFGIAAMKKNLEKLLEATTDPAKGNRIINLIEDLNSRLIPVQERGFKGTLKGGEVGLPRPGADLKVSSNVSYSPFGK